MDLSQTVVEIQDIFPFLGLIRMRSAYTCLKLPLNTLFKKTRSSLEI